MRGKDFFVPREAVFSSHTQFFSRTLLAVQFYYICIFTIAIGVSCYEWDRLYDSNFSAPLWPLKILGWPANFGAIINGSYYIFIFGSLLAALKPQIQIFRIMSFVGTLMIIGLYNSDGLIGNNMDMMLYPTFFLQFLPNIKNKNRSTKHLYITIFWFAQLSMCIAYAMAGYFKVTGIASCLLHEGWQGCEVGPKIMTSMAAREALQFREPTFAGNLLYVFPLFGGISYVGVIWFHVISLFFAFRLDMHRFFLAMRLVFHYGTLIFFGIGFSTTIMMVVALFAVSPFKSSEIKSLKQFLSRLPPLGWVFK